MTPETTAPAASSAISPRIAAREDPAWVRWLLISITLLVVGVLIVVPVVHVFHGALADGLGTYWHNLFGDPDTRHSIFLTMAVVPIAVAANIVFGLAAAWAIARFRFPGRTILTSLVDLPFSVSPVVVGLMYVLLFGLQGYLGPFLRNDGYAVMPWLVSFLLAGAAAGIALVRPPRRFALHRRSVVVVAALVTFVVAFALQKGLGVWPENASLKIIFAFPGLVLATSFVTFPFVARELLPVMEALGPDEETAAVSLGANGWQMFRDVTLPNVKWGLAYGIVLCTARAMGEFGAVYVVSGHIAGKTDTMPLRIEKLFQEYNLPGAFAVASLLTSMAIITLVAKTRLERRIASQAPQNDSGAQS